MAYTVAKIPVRRATGLLQYIYILYIYICIYIYITCRIRLFLVYVVVKIASSMVFTLFFLGFFAFEVSVEVIPGTGRKSADCYRPSWEP